MSILKDNLLSLVVALFLLYSANCFADINLEISSITAPSDLSSIPPFINTTESTNTPVNPADIQDTLNTVNSKLASALVESYPGIKVLNTESGIVVDITKSNTESALANNYRADLLLYGELTKFNSIIATNQLEQTGQQSELYYLNIAVHYKLIQVKDKKIIANFIAVGSAGDSAIHSSKLNFSYHNYLPQATNDLFNSALSSLTTAFYSKDIIDNIESSVISK